MNIDFTKFKFIKKTLFQSKVGTNFHTPTSSLCQLFPNLPRFVLFYEFVRLAVLGQLYCAVQVKILCKCTAVHVYKCTSVQVYKCTSVQVYN